MKPSELLNLYRPAIREIVAKNHALNPRVFGSVLSGQDTEESDLDLLVDTDPKQKTSLFDLAGIQIDLESLLHISVDVRTPGDLPIKFRDQVLQEAQAV